jgi:hypothetical protein
MNATHNSTKKFRVRRIATPPTPSISLVRRRRCQKYLRKKAGLKRPFANAELLAPVKRVSTLGTPSTQLLRRIAKRFLLLMFTLSGTFDYSCLL